MGFSRRTGGKRRTGGRRRMGGRRRTGGNAMGVVNQALTPAVLYGLQKHMQNKKRKGPRAGGVSGMLSKVKKAFGGNRTRRVGGRRRGGTRRR